MKKCLVCPEETRGKSKFCSARCRKVYSRGGLKDPAETQRRRNANQRRKAARERSKGRAARVIAATVTPPEIHKRKQPAARTKFEIEAHKMHTRGWQGPAHVIDANFPVAVEVVSADGVVSFVSRLAQRLLVR
jgi:hypothetical protein